MFQAGAGTALCRLFCRGDLIDGKTMTVNTLDPLRQSELG